MNITKVTTAKSRIDNTGTINIGDNTTDGKKAELRAYGVMVNNTSTALDKQGVINNYGVVGSTSGTSGQFNNFGLINMMNDDAMTLLKSNEKTVPSFNHGYSATYKMGTVVLPEGNPYAIVSVANKAENGFIKYNWNSTTYTHDPGNVKYNTIVVSDNIEFTGAAATEVQYIEFNGVRKQVVNPETTSEPKGKLTNLKGIIVNPGKSIIIEKTNIIECTVGAYLGEGATVYKGGKFIYPSGATTNYFGTWSKDQVVVYGD